MAQRLRLVYRRSGETKYLSHLEMMKVWERGLRRAGWRLAQSQGFNPHPKISFAAPLPVGVATEADLVEVTLEEGRDPSRAAAEISAQMPAGLAVLSVEEIPVDSPPVQRFLRAAEYHALAVGGDEDALRREAERIAAAESLPRQRLRDGRAQQYDLRPMIQELGVERSPEGDVLLRMRLRTDAQGAGRPDEVLRELGLDPADCAITRTRLILA